MKNAIGNCITTDKWQNGNDFENGVNETDIHFIKQVLDLRRATYGEAIRNPKTPTRPELVRLACVLAVARKLTNCLRRNAAMDDSIGGSEGVTFSPMQDDAPAPSE